MKERAKSAAYAAALLILALAAGISAVKVYEYAFENKISTASVSIDLAQLTLDADGNMTEASPTSVMPGEKVSYIPMVENQRADAYVRVKVEIAMEKDTTAPITADNLYTETKPLTENEVYTEEGANTWIRKGDYFYNTKPMKAGDKSSVFDGIAIPETWVADLKGSLPASGLNDPAQASGFVVVLTADAIQSENFTPDFDADMPWGSVQIEEAKSEDNHTYNTAEPVVVRNRMTFRGNSGLEANTKDLFNNFGNVVAGDTCTDTLVINNESGSGITVYFMTDNKASDLTDKMTLNISNGGKKVYTGDLTSSSLGEYKELLHIDPGKSSDLQYEIKLPEDAQNYYSVLDDSVVWKFKVVEDEKPNTGEDKMLLVWLMVFLLSVIAALSLITYAKKHPVRVKS